MTTYHPEAQTAPPLRKPEPGKLDQTAQLWALLYGTWGSPRRASRMTSRREHDRKYSDIEAYSFNVNHLAAHLAGIATYAATLGAASTARAGCKGYDSADEAELCAALDQAQQKGITAAAILMPGRAGEHAGGHIWVFYDRPYAESDIRAQLRTIRRSGKGEDYPSGNPIRLPFGYHQIKKTRGMLLLQDKRRFNLDTQLDAAIDALLALPRNGKPEPAPAGDTRISGTSWGDAYKPNEWDNLPDGGPLWHSAYVAAVASRAGREPLAALLRGERAVIVKKDDTIDDSDSAQIAALCYNLMSGNVCEAHIRAIALYLKDTIRPGRALEHFKAHVDAELVRYRPAHYKPQPILRPGIVQQAAPIPTPQHKHEPKSRARKDRPQRVTGPAGYLAWLRTQIDPQTDNVMLSQAQCAERIGCCVRTIKRYEKALGAQIERRIFAQRQAGCLFILAPDVVTTLPADVVIADAVIAQQNAENAQSAIAQEEHTAPPVTQPPAAPHSLAETVRLAFDLVHVNRDTGERRRITRKRLHLALTELLPSLPPAATLDRAIADERQRRRIAAIIADIRTMKPPTLRAQLRLMERLGDKSRADGSNLHRFTDWAARELRAELPSRPAAPGRKPRKNCEALPDLRENARQHQAAIEAREQAELWAAADRELARRKPAPLAGTRGGVCSPQPAPAGAITGPEAYSSPIARATIASLRQRQQVAL